MSICALPVILGVFLSGCDKSTKPIVAESRPTHQDSVVANGSSPKSFCLIAPGQKPTDAIKGLGEPLADHGSGVSLLEFKLEPHGYSIVQIIGDNLAGIELVWSSKIDSGLPDRWSATAASSNPVISRRGKYTTSQPVEICDATRIQLGIEMNDALQILGLPLSASNNGHCIAPFLVPGFIELQSGADRRINVIEIAWSMSNLSSE